jgi:hypothetical protein
MAIVEPSNGLTKVSVTVRLAPPSIYRAFTQLWPAPPGLHVARNPQGTPSALRNVALSLSTASGEGNCVSSSTYTRL